MPDLSVGVTAHLELGRIADKKNDFSPKGDEMQFVAATLVGLAVLPAGVSAHHSTAEYDTSTVVELTGELVGVRWRNPHVMFTVRVNGSDGAVQDWELATGAVYVVERTGLDESEFTVGAQVRVAGFPSARRPTAMSVTNILLPGGAEVLFAGASGNRWSDDFSGGRWIGEQVNREERGLYRVWSLRDPAAYTQATEGMEIRLTEEAQAKMASAVNFDPCVPQGMPGVMANPLPIEFIDRGDHIDLQLTAFAVLRRIDMTTRADPDSVPSSDLGYSVGRWAGDTLEVRTTRVSWPYLDDAGRPLTENVEILERFSLTDGRNRLSYSQTVTDPESLVEPLVTSWDWIDIGEDQIDTLVCE